MDCFIWIIDVDSSHMSGEYAVGSLAGHWESLSQYSMGISGAISVELLIGRRLAFNWSCD